VLRQRLALVAATLAEALAIAGIARCAATQRWPRRTAIPSTPSPAPTPATASAAAAARAPH